MVGNNSRKQLIIPTPCPLCSVSTFFFFFFGWMKRGCSVYKLFPGLENVLYRHLWGLSLAYFCVTLLQLSYIKNHVIPSFSSIVLQKMLLNPFPLKGGSGLLIFQMCILFSRIRVFSENSCWNTINIHALETPPQNSPRLLRRAGRAWVQRAFCHEFPSERGSAPGYILPHCLFHSKQICLARHWWDLNLKTQAAPNLRLPVRPLAHSHMVPSLAEQRFVLSSLCRMLVLAAGRSG